MWRKLVHSFHITSIVSHQPGCKQLLKVWDSHSCPSGTLFCCLACRNLFLHWLQDIHQVLQPLSPWSWKHYYQAWSASPSLPILLLHLFYFMTGEGYQAVKKAVWPQYQAFLSGVLSDAKTVSTKKVQVARGTLHASFSEVFPTAYTLLTVGPLGFQVSTECYHTKKDSIFPWKVFAHWDDQNWTFFCFLYSCQ